MSWPFILAMVALLLIACGNGLFKGNLQAIVGQLYDDFEAEAAKEGPEALAAAKEKRDSGFQIFYVFINIGGVIAPFVAPLIRDWWLKTKDLVYNADLPRLCHSAVANFLWRNRKPRRFLPELLACVQHRRSLFFHRFCGCHAHLFGYLCCCA